MLNAINDKPIRAILAPGRVNLLGEHVDYNGGIVLPAAIDRYVRLDFRELAEPIIRLNAVDLRQHITISLEHIEEKRDTEGGLLPAFAYYPAGVAWSLMQAGLEVKGIEAVYSSSVPIGSGLSSSAAIQVAFAAAWQNLAGWEIDRMDLALLCKQAENKYIGVQSGLMDQFASIFGVAGHVLYLDTRNLDWKPIPLPQNTAIVIADSRVPRSLAGSAYNERRSDCEQAVKILQQHLPGIKNLRDIGPDQFALLAHHLPDRQQKRARFVIEEISRVSLAVDYLESGNAHDFGELMFQCHEGLRDLYEVSCPELDTLVEIAARLPGCLGARLTGAGFGGCTVNLVLEEFVESFIDEMLRCYQQLSGKTASVYLCHAADGAAVVG